MAKYYDRVLHPVQFAELAAMMLESVCSYDYGWTWMHQEREKEVEVYMVSSGPRRVLTEGIENLDRYVDALSRMGQVPQEDIAVGGKIRTWLRDEKGDFPDLPVS